MIMAQQEQTLRQYQDYLRERMEAARGEDSSEKIMLLGFLSGGRQYLIDSRDVMEVNQVSELEPIPLGKPWAVGAANIKGSVHAIIDFSVLMGGERTKRGKFLVLTDEIMPLAAIYIEAIAGLFPIDVVGDLSLKKEVGMPDWIAGNYHLGQRYFLVDASKLAVDASFSKLQSGESQ